MSVSRAGPCPNPSDAVDEMGSDGSTDQIEVPTKSAVPAGWLPAAIGGRYTTVRWVHAGEAHLE